MGEIPRIINIDRQDLQDGEKRFEVRMFEE